MLLAPPRSESMLDDSVRFYQTGITLSTPRAALSPGQTRDSIITGALRFAVKLRHAYTQLR